jgi:hypothetical protein
MAERRQCTFQLIRYVPDPVRNEFVNIGVVLQTEEQSLLRFTRDWSRVRCLDPDADTQMLEALEIEASKRLHSQELPSTPTPMQKPILERFEDSLSNNLQITESKGYLAETVKTGLEDLMRRYVDNPRREKSRRLGGRSSVRAAMREHFEKAGVWELMQKNIAASQYTEAGDPLRIDCGYQNGFFKMFQAISLETDAGDAKLLAYSAPALKEGVKKRLDRKLELTAIIEPITWPEGDGQPGNEMRDRYKYTEEIMKKYEVRLLTTSALQGVADTARRDLNA